MASAPTPKRKAGGSNPPEDTISKIAKVIFHVKDGLRIFHFELITKISQRMPLAEFSVSANKIRLPANEAPRAPFGLCFRLSANIGKRFPASNKTISIW